MYAAKRSGRNCLQLFSAALGESGADELELESEGVRSRVLERFDDARHILRMVQA